MIHVKLSNEVLADVGVLHNWGSNCSKEMEVLIGVKERVKI